MQKDKIIHSTVNSDQGQIKVKKYIYFYLYNMKFIFCGP